jgi:hypothetical protein
LLTELTSSIFDARLDVHAGGIDLKFPHHENEVAQCLACFPGVFAYFGSQLSLISVSLLCLYLSSVPDIVRMVSVMLTCGDRRSGAVAKLLLAHWSPSHPRSQDEQVPEEFHLCEGKMFLRRDLFSLRVVIAFCQDFLKEHTATDLRLLCLLNRYENSIDCSPERWQETGAFWKKLYDFRRLAEELGRQAVSPIEKWTGKSVEALELFC